MEILFHTHHAHVGDYLRRRVTIGVEKLARRLERVTRATARFSLDGDVRRVEVELDVPGRRLVGKGEGKGFSPALSEALRAIERQIGHVKGTREKAVRREAATRRVQQA